MCVPWWLFLLGIWLIIRALDQANRPSWLPTIAPPPSPELIAKERARDAEAYRRKQAAYAELAQEPWWLTLHGR